MSRRAFVTPRRGLVVRFPGTGAVLPDTGAHVEVDGYWRRRLRVGDVQATQPKRGRPAASESRPTSNDEDNP